MKSLLRIAAAIPLLAALCIAAENAEKGHGLTAPPTRRSAEEILQEYWPKMKWIREELPKVAADLAHTDSKRRKAALEQAMSLDAFRLRPLMDRLRAIDDPEIWAVVRQLEPTRATTPLVPKPEIIEIMKNAVDGDGRSQGILSGLFRLGQGGLKKDKKDGERWAKLALESGHPFGLSAHVSCLHEAALLSHSTRDLKKAMMMYPDVVRAIQKLAEDGDALAQYKMGDMYQYGRGMPIDLAKALRWYRKSAAQGNARGEYGIGGLYLVGKGVPKDMKEARKWMLKAARKGQAGAQYNLGWMYAAGDGVEHDFDRAARWLIAAAEQDLGAAEFVLARPIHERVFL